MRFVTFLIMMALVMFFSSSLNDYIKDGRVINLFATVLAAMGIFIQLINYLVLCMKG